MQHMSPERDPQQSRWWTGLIVFLLILCGAIWFALEQYAATAPAHEARTIPFAIRKEVQLSPDYVVAVKYVNLNANEAIAKANPSSPPPTGQYVVATLTIRPVGSTTGDPAKDLVVTYVGADARSYGTSTCRADVNAARPGQYSVCFDLPPDVISGGKVGVAPSDSPHHPKYWEINN
jgi:hypothetical protein